MADLLGPELLNPDQDRFRESEPPRRCLPWPIDVWLYPINEAGLTMLAVFLLTPVAIAAVNLFIRWVAGMIPPLAVWWLFIHFLLLFFGVAVALCYVRYLLLCIYTSADGQVRAPELLGAGLEEDYLETIGQIFRGIGTVAVCLLPGIIYGVAMRRVDGVLVGLVAAGLFVLPMALLSVVMEESLTGLNPVRLVVGIARTFVWYVPLAVMFVVPLVGMVVLMVAKAIPWYLALPVRLSVMYVQFVMAHLLGWFYYRNEGRLDWF